MRWPTLQLTCSVKMSWDFITTLCYHIWQRPYPNRNVITCKERSMPANKKHGGYSEGPRCRGDATAAEAVADRLSLYSPQGREYFKHAQCCAHTMLGKFG